MRIVFITALDNFFIESEDVGLDDRGVIILQDVIGHIFPCCKVDGFIFTEICMSSIGFATALDRSGINVQCMQVLGDLPDKVIDDV